MKKPILILVALLVAIALPARATTIPILKVGTVSGTIQTQIATSPTNAKIHTEKLDTKRIFEEYQVSKTDYELVFDLNGSGYLELLPKSASSGLPTIVIVTTGSGFAEAIDIQNHTVKLVTVIGTNTATNLFKDLAGSIAGTAHFQGSLVGGNAFVDKINYSVVAVGTDTVGNSGAILKFKVTAKGIFTQAP